MLTSPLYPLCQLLCWKTIAMENHLLPDHLVQLYSGEPGVSGAQVFAPGDSHKRCPRRPFQMETTNMFHRCFRQSLGLKNQRTAAAQKHIGCDLFPERLLKNEAWPECALHKKLPTTRPRQRPSHGHLPAEVPPNLADPPASRLAATTDSKPLSL